MQNRRTFGGQRERLRRRIVPILVVLAFATIALGAWANRLATESARRVSADELTRQVMTADALHTVHDPLLAELAGVLVAEGIDAAVGRIEVLSASDVDLAHHYGHELGLLAYGYYGNAAEAFRRCPSSPDFGCHHSVVQAYFASNPRFDRADVNDFCDGGAIDAGALPILRFQCFHGLGHSLTRLFDYRLDESLDACDHREEARDRESCYGGVFMESIDHHALARERSREIAPDPSSREESLLSPCDRVADIYRPACYLQQPMVILPANGYDFGAGFAACERAPAAFIVSCYRGMGGMATLIAAGNPVQAHTLCALGSTPYRVWCSDGAVWNLISLSARADEALAFCAASPPEIAAFCFEAIGEGITTISDDPAAQRHTCAQAGEPEWVRSCLGAARLEA